MHKLRTFICCILLITTPSHFVYSQNQYSFQKGYSKKKLKRNFRKTERYHLLTYDEILSLLQEIESGKAEKAYRPKDLKRIDRFVNYLAVHGDLLHTNMHLVFQKNWFGKSWKKTKEFVKKHKKEIIIGAVVVVAAAAVITAVAVTCSAGAATAGAAGAAGAATNQSKSKPPTPSETQIPETALEEQISSIKKDLFKDQTALQNEELSWEETGRILGPLLAHESFYHMQTSSASVGHHEIDRKFSTDYATAYRGPRAEDDFMTLFYQMRGERAMTQGYLEQAVKDFGKAIQRTPTSPLSYLERSTAYFQLGDYDRSLEDFKAFTSRAPKTYSLSVSEFSFGFAKGLPQGIYESGEGILLFLTDLITNPIYTGGQLWEALTLLTSLARTEQWNVLGEALAPEAHQLITEWEAIPSDQRGELAGYAFGKYGADIIVPGALAKALKRGVKGAQELNAVYKSLKTAENTLVLESVAELESGTNVKRIIHNKAASHAETYKINIREINELGKNQLTNENVYRGDLLKIHLRQLEEYGPNGFRQLSNGRIRYYGELEPAKVKGEMAGRRLVREWDPETGSKRTWHETLDHQDNIRIIRPETNNMKKIHYIFDRDGNFVEVRE